MHASPAFRALAGIALVVAAGACSRFAVRTAADPDVDFARLTTFAWLPRELAPPRDQWLQDPAIERLVVSGVEAGFRDAGYRPAHDGAPDLWVTYRLLTDWRAGRGVPPTYDGYDLGWWLESYTADTVDYERGSLIIDVIEADDMGLVWRGSASAQLLPQASFERKWKRATKAVEQIMKDFPAR
jgi:Domain of unknown function (DUF4136)